VTVADAEGAGVSIAWDYCDTVALDSQGVIQRIHELMHQGPHSWIEGKLVAQMAERPRRLMWVRGHQGEEGNEESDQMAKREVRVGERMHMPDIVTPAGIRQAYPLHPKAPAHLKRSREAVGDSRF